MCSPDLISYPSFSGNMENCVSQPLGVRLDHVTSSIVEDKLLSQSHRALGDVFYCSTTHFIFTNAVDKLIHYWILTLYTHAITYRILKTHEVLRTPFSTKNTVVSKNSSLFS